MRLPEALFAARTMQALEALAMQPLSAPQLAAALQIHPRTARRLLNRLREEGYVSRSDGRPAAVLADDAAGGAGRARRRAGRAGRAAAPYVQRLHEEVGGVAHLMVPSYTSALCLVHCADGARRGRSLRELVPSHCTAPGKALLGHRDAWRESVLAAAARGVDAADADRSGRAARGGRRDRAQGYAVEDGEYEVGVRAVAAPVFARAATRWRRSAPRAARWAARRVAARVRGVAAELTLELAQERDA